MVGGLFSTELLDERPGLVVIKVSGKKAFEVFKDEAGGHRWQRSPPTEKRGRIQTSTVTVAVLRIPDKKEINLLDKDLRWSYCRGSGAGGQHRNVTDSAVQLKHLPTGIQVRCESERSQYLNKETALQMLRAKLVDQQKNYMNNNIKNTRKSQIGTGQRGDKRRTIRVKDGTVKDHLTGKTWDYKKYRRGDW